MIRTNPYVTVYEERFGPLAGAPQAIVRALPHIREAVADEAERLAAEFVARQAPSPYAPRDDRAPDEDIARVEALRPLVARIMLGAIGEVLATAAGDADRGTVLLHALEHELMLPPRQAPGPAADPGIDSAGTLRESIAAAAGPGRDDSRESLDRAIAAWHRSGHTVAQHALYGRPGETPEADAPGTGDAPPVRDDMPGTGPTGDARVYASLRRRLAAVIVDLSILWSVWVVAAFVQQVAGLEGDVYEWIVLLTPAVYFGAFEMRWHATPGKALLGLGVYADHAEGMGWPGRILLREIVGRLLNQVLWGAGYWVAIRHPHRQSWGDRLAGTVVVRHPAPRWLRRTAKSLAPASALVLVFSLWASGWVTEARRVENEVTPEFKAAVDGVTASDARIDTLMSRRVHTA